MKKWRSLSLNIKLLVCFFSAVFMLSLFHFTSYLRMLDTLTSEAQAGANERMSSAVARLDESLSQIRSHYFSLTYTPSFRSAGRSGNPSEYELLDLYNNAALYLGNQSGVLGFALLFSGSDMVVTSSGNYTDADFFARCLYSPQYGAQFWQEEKRAVFAQRYYSAASFRRASAAGEGTLMLPVAFKPYWNSSVMLLLFLDVRSLCEGADHYLAQDFYIFSADGPPLYASRSEPALTSLPQQEDALFQSPDGNYVARRASSAGDLIYIKLLPKNIVVGQITSSMYFSLFTTLLALAVGVGIVAVSVWRLMHPVQDILHLFSNEGALAGKADELHYIRANVESMLRQREQYVQQLSRKDAALSGFLLQSQLKNIYVELDTPAQRPPAQSRTFFILYFRVHYHSGIFEHISAAPQAVAYMLLETLHQALNRLFETALIFQLEPNQFVAKVSLNAEEADISPQMEQIMQRLANEQEFAFFTVVQSGALRADGDFTAVYARVLDAAQYALVESRTQLLRLPLELSEANSFSFPTEQEQRLCALVRDGQADQAAALVRQVVSHNLSCGIRRIHMILLCSAITGAVVRTLSELHAGGGASDRCSSVYNHLPRCDTAGDYQELVAGFVREAVGSAALPAQEADAILTGVQSYLERNYQREFSMDELADALHLSKSYLSTYYKGKTGTNLSDRIQFYRIQRAVDLLADPALRIGDIAAQVGIGNSNTFLRQFKKYTGITPKEYRVRQLSGH